MTKRNAILAEVLLFGVRGGVTAGRVWRFVNAVDDLDSADLAKVRLVETSHWGGDPRRYGKAKKRLGRCAYLGGGGRNPGGKPYQIWVDWS